VLKTARGGYDGKGVWSVDDMAQVAAVTAPLVGQLLVEEMVPLEAELAVMVARRPSGQTVTWPAVETAQVDGVCREVLVPGRLPPDVLERARALGQAVAEIAGAVGVLAVELFWSGGVLMVNEIAARPHNSGHWTIEGAVTSQFENHLRAVLDLPLGSPAPQHAQVASVNVFGGAAGEDPLALLPGGLATEGAHIHLYGKGARPGRKLGHVTVCGDDAEEVRERAWSAAMALGTPRPQPQRAPMGRAS
jgi:5-(carboxyamino)imidazole ribonucleotide synthase